MNRSMTGLKILLLVVAALLAAPVHAQVRGPLGNPTVRVEWENGKSFFFQDVSGLGAEIEVVEFREGGDPGTTRKLPGRTKYANIVLKRGYTAHDEFWQWIEDTRVGNPTRKDLTITLLSARGGTIAQFHLIDCFPTRWDVHTDRSALLPAVIEDIEITTELVELVR